MTYIPNTPFGRVLREELDRAKEANRRGYSDGKEGIPPAEPNNERYMRGWREGRRARNGG